MRPTPSPTGPRPVRARIAPLLLWTCVATLAVPPLTVQAQAGADPAASAPAAPATPAVATTPTPGGAAADRPAASWDDDSRAHRQGGDVFLAGGTPSIVDPVAGDLFIAGGSMDVEAPVAGDVFAIGGRLQVAGDVGQSLHALGGQIDVRSRVGRNLRVAGGQLELSSQGRVMGNVSAVGGQLRLRGPVQGHVMVAGGRVLIDGPVAGDVTATSGELALGPNARIAGRLSYRSGEDLRADPAAEVAGGIERLAPAPRGAGDRDDGRWERSADGHGRGAGVAGGLGAAWTVGLMVLAGVLLAVMPGVLAGTSRTARTRGGASLLLGFALIVCVPVAVLVLLVTIIGIPVALFGLALYLAALPLAYVTGAIGLADWALMRWQAARAAHRGWRFGAACLVLLVLALAGWVPFVGWLAGLAVLLLGLGAIVLQLARPTAAVPAAGA